MIMRPRTGRRARGRRSLLAAAVALLASTVSAAGIVVETGDTVAFLGDSITAQGWSNAHGYVRLVVAGLEANGVRITPVPAGVGGNTSTAMLARVERDVLAKKPAWVVVHCGMNDVILGEKGTPLEAYRTAMGTLLDRCRDAGGKVVVMTTTTAGKADSEASRRLGDYAACLRDLAKERRFLVADLYPVFVEQVGRADTLHALTYDGVHMMPEGNMVIADVLLRTLGCTEAELAKAREGWLDLPDTGSFSTRVDIELNKRFFVVRTAATLRQREKLLAAAALAKRPTLMHWSKELLMSLVKRQVKPDGPYDSIDALFDPAVKPVVEAELQKQFDAEIARIVSPPPAAAAAPDAGETAGDFPPGLAAILARNAGARTAPFTQTPSGQLPDGLLLGNGDVGVVVAGTPSRQEFYVGKNDFWAPFDTYGYLRTDLPESERGIGQLMYPIGGISIEIPGMEKAAFRHDLDLGLAESRSVFTAGDRKLRETARVVATDNIVLIEVENEGTAPVEMTVSTWTRPNNLLRVGKGVSIPDTSTAGVDGDVLWIARDSATKAGDLWVTHGSIATRVLGAPTRPEAAALRGSARVTLEAGRRIVVAASVGNAVHFAEGFKLSTVRSLVAEGEESLPGSKARVRGIDTDAVAALTAAHRRWWDRYWTKAFIALPDEPLLERFFYGAVYLMGSGARAGKLPPGLFGPWVTVDRPTWAGDYHLDYNHEHPWYNVYAVNRPELAIPYFDSIVNLLPLARETARTMRQPGIVYRTCAGPYGWAHPGTHNMPNNAELAVNFRDYHEFTRDDTFLRDVAYPFLKEVALNWDAKLVKVPGTSGEPDDYRYTIRLAWDESQKVHDNPTSGLAYCRALYRALVEASTTLDLDPESRRHWQDVVDHLAAYATTRYKDRTVLDFAEGANAPEGNPYPYNTYPFYPAATEGPDSPYREALINTLATRPSYWSQANAFTQVFAAAASAGYPADELLERLRSRLARELSDTGVLRVPGHSTIENAFSVNNVVLLLLQSTGGCIRVFPAWDLAKPARFENLMARGAFLVTSEVRDGAIRYVRLTSEKGGTATIANPWPGRNVRVSRDGGRTEVFTGERLTIPTEAHERLELTPEESP